MQGVERLIDGTTDIWAVGATLFQLLTGKTPFEPLRGQPRRNIIGQVLYSDKPAPDIRAKAREQRVEAIKAGRRATAGNVSNDVAIVVAISLSKPRELRFQSCVEMREALAKTVAGRRWKSSETFA